MIVNKYEEKYNFNKYTIYLRYTSVLLVKELFHSKLEKIISVHIGTDHTQTLVSYMGHSSL